MCDGFEQKRLPASGDRNWACERRASGAHEQAHAQLRRCPQFESSCASQSHVHAGVCFSSALPLRAHIRQDAPVLRRWRASFEILALPKKRFSPICTFGKEVRAPRRASCRLSRFPKWLQRAVAMRSDTVGTHMSWRMKTQEASDSLCRLL